ncbi:hypothetical protein Mgra_00010085 [Meloidogyne graminicola]|uniref:Biotin carboxylase-like N-terminal domain-containing protein n=1 Tax=Meloidogyne graminicola TaxID=189291 RepID=A0A8S9ZBD7_9BILA|nr:hypothetical protein Mgra_00010085 [Meloidogyne graminicola]
MYTIVSLLCLRLFSHNSSTLFLKRVIRTARNMGIETVAIYSDADQNSLHASLTDSSFRIGPSTSSQAILILIK